MPATRASILPANQPTVPRAAPGKVTMLSKTSKSSDTASQSWSTVRRRVLHHRTASAMMVRATRPGPMPEVVSIQ